MENRAAWNSWMDDNLLDPKNISTIEIDESIRYQMWPSNVAELGKCRTWVRQDDDAAKTIAIIGPGRS